MGPTCDVLLEDDDDATLALIGVVLSNVSERVDRTRRGRVWGVWVRGAPIHVEISTSPPAVGLSGGRNTNDEYVVLREIAHEIAQAVGGEASEPLK